MLCTNVYSTVCFIVNSLILQVLGKWNLLSSENSGSDRGNVLLAQN